MRATRSTRRSAKCADPEVAPGQAVRAAPTEEARNEPEADKVQELIDATDGETKSEVEDEICPEAVEPEEPGKSAERVDLAERVDPVGPLSKYAPLFHRVDVS